MEKGCQERRVGSIYSRRAVTPCHQSQKGYDSRVHLSSTITSKENFRPSYHQTERHLQERLRSRHTHSSGKIARKEVVDHRSSSKLIQTRPSLANITNKDPPIYRQRSDSKYKQRLLDEIHNSNHLIMGKKGYIKERQQIRKSVVSDMKAYNPYEHIKNDKIKNFEEKYNSILASYEKKKRELSDEFKQFQHSTKKTNIFQQKLRNTSDLLIQTSMSKTVDLGSKSIFTNTNKVPIKDLLKENNAFGFTLEANKTLNKKSYPSQPISNKDTKGIKIHSQFEDFFNALLKQVQFEEKVRNLKHQIASHPKKDQIISNLAMKGIGKEQAKLNTEQYDPFNTCNTPRGQADMEKITNEYTHNKKQSDQNWKTHILNKWQANLVERLFEKLDYSQKNELMLKDFVREINCQSNKNFRIRDLFKIHQRLKPVRRDNFIRKLSTIDDQS